MYLIPRLDRQSDSTGKNCEGCGSHGCDKQTLGDQEDVQSCKEESRALWGAPAWPLAQDFLEVNANRWLKRTGQRWQATNQEVVAKRQCQEEPPKCSPYYVSDFVLTFTGITSHNPSNNSVKLELWSLYSWGNKN